MGIQYVSPALPRRIKCFMFSTKPAITRQHSELNHGCYIIWLTSLVRALMKLWKGYSICVCCLAAKNKMLYVFYKARNNSTAFRADSWLYIVDQFCYLIDAIIKMALHMTLWTAKMTKVLLVFCFPAKLVSIRQLGIFDTWLTSIARALVINIYLLCHEA